MRRWVLLKILTATEAKLILEALQDATYVMREEGYSDEMQACLDAIQILEKLAEVTAEEVIK